MLAALKRKIFGTSNGAAEGSASKSLARSRLHFVLVQDRAGLSSDEMARFKEEMISVIERYFVINKTGFDISYKRDSDSSTLLINSPILVRRRANPGADPAAAPGAKSSANARENAALATSGKSTDKDGKEPESQAVSNLS